MAPYVEDPSELTMYSSSTSRDDGSATQKIKRSGSVKVLLENLRLCQILRQGEAESRLKHFNLILNTKLPEW